MKKTHYEQEKSFEEYLAELKKYQVGDGVDSLNLMKSSLNTSKSNTSFGTSFYQHLLCKSRYCFKKDGKYYKLEKGIISSCKRTEFTGWLRELMNCCE